MKFFILEYFIFLFVALHTMKAQESFAEPCDNILVYTHPISFEPVSYYSIYTDLAIDIDGKIEEEAWEITKWSEPFIDIEGFQKNLPEKETKVKLLWNQDYLYIAARMEEDHLWYTLTEKDNIIFQDDDFEIFIDPDGDGHNYAEIEINEFNAVWDLFLMYPYYVNKKQNYLMNWEAKGLKTAVFLSGTPNDPSDIDQYWSVEIAIPWDVLRPFAFERRKPKPNEYWRINFSRVDWLMEIMEGNYIKKKNENGNILPERNWVGSPIGYINMHKPELWGYLVFQDKAGLIFERPKDEFFKWTMWQIYYSIKQYFLIFGFYPKDLDCINIPENEIGVNKENFEIYPGLLSFELVGKFENKTWILDDKGWIHRKMK